MPLLRVKTVFLPGGCRGKMKLSRQFAVFGSAIFSLYLLLDRALSLGYPMSPAARPPFPRARLKVARKKYIK